MQLGMIGLGRMGANMVHRLLKGGHQCVVYDMSPKAVADVVKEKAVGTASLAEFAKNLTKPSEAMARWVVSNREQLEKLTAREPEKPKDFRRSASVDCKCKYCSELKLFLENPTEAEHRFRYSQEHRSHLENIIHNNQCDLDVSTDRKGSPHTLVARKNVASYQRKLKTYQENLEYLVAVRSAEEHLPR